MYDYHMHSKFSNDAKNTLSDMANAAYLKGAKEICMTDHLELDSPFGDNFFEISEYTKAIELAQKNYPKMIIKKGIEIGVQRDNLDRISKFIEKGEFDFVLASVHSAQGLGVHDEKFIANKTWDQVIESYYSEIYECAKNFKNYQVLGHIDLIKRYHSYLGKISFEKHYDQIDMILKLIIEDGKGIEVNTGGLRYPNCNNLNPSIDILKRYKKLNGEIITFGSDSHDMESVLYNYNETIEILKSIGYKYISTFEKGVVKFISI